MSYLSKIVWCQPYYTQHHHQEERKGIFGGLFFCVCFQFTFTAETAFENSYKKLHILRDSWFYVVRDDASTMFL